MNGSDSYDLQKILGHSSLEMTQRYAHLSPTHLEKAIRIVAFSGSDDAAEEKNNPLVIPNSGETRFSVVRSGT